MVSFSCEVCTSTRSETSDTAYREMIWSDIVAVIELRRRSHEEEVGFAPQSMLRRIVYMYRLHGTLLRNGLSCAYSNYPSTRPSGMR